MPDFPSKDDLADQCERYARTFSLNVMLETSVASIDQDATTKHWSIGLIRRGKDGSHERLDVRAKHLVQATGIGSSVPYTPKLCNEAAEYGGQVLHSANYKNAHRLADSGVKVWS